MAEAISYGKIGDAQAGPHLPRKLGVLSLSVRLHRPSSIIRLQHCWPRGMESHRFIPRQLPWLALKAPPAPLRAETFRPWPRWLGGFIGSASSSPPSIILCRGSGSTGGHGWLGLGTPWPGPSAPRHPGSTWSLGFFPRPILMGTGGRRVPFASCPPWELDGGLLHPVRTCSTTRSQRCSPSSSSTAHPRLFASARSHHILAVGQDGVGPGSIGSDQPTGGPAYRACSALSGAGPNGLQRHHRAIHRWSWSVRPLTCWTGGNPASSSPARR